MGQMLETCRTLIFEDVEYVQECPQDNFFGQGCGPQLRLRVDWNPIRESLGTVCCPFSLTDELVVEELNVQGPRGWEPLGLRHEAYAKERGNANMWTARNGQRPSAPSMPGGPRFSVPRRFARARIGRGWYVLQLALSPQDRTMEIVKEDILDSKDAASFAHAFNTHIRRSMGEGDGQSDVDPSQVPCVRVCAPVGCAVLETNVPHVMGGRSGEVVTLAPYPSQEVKKFVFDGKEDFLEMPQAFFHYATWLSGGKEMLFDLQGMETDDGSVLLLDPCVLRAPKVGVKDLLSTIADPHTSAAGAAGGDASAERFDQLHGKCGQLCKVFDPERRGARAAKRVCGLDTKCGLQQR